MTNDEIKIGEHYVARVSERRAVLRIVGPSTFGGWDAVNVGTGRTVRVRSARRLRYHVRNLAGRWVAVTACPNCGEEFRTKDLPAGWTSCCQPGHIG